MATAFTLRDATPADVPVVVHFVRALAEYEKLLHEAKGTEAGFAAALFGPTPRAAAIIAEADGKAVGLCVWYRTFSTFTARHGIWVEDIFVEPAYRGRGIARAIFKRLAQQVKAAASDKPVWSRSFPLRPPQRPPMPRPVPPRPRPRHLDPKATRHAA